MVQTRIKNVWRDLKLSESSFAMVARKYFNGKFTKKNDFPIEHFMFITDSDIGKVKILFGKYLYHMLVKFERNRMA